ncbi:MAG: hypothetical protein JWO20_2844, partial [Candidatus Angelobacter sp.]|nr:hypothetical protein [Candidatus Angelobacter sp.]
AAWDKSSVVRVGQNKLFLVSGIDGERKLLFADKENCLVFALFLNDDHILIRGCKHGNFVVNRQGLKLYKIPAYVFPYFAVNSLGTRFAVYERRRSFLHELGEGSYDKMRVAVHSATDGKKLFEYKFSATNDENINDGQISLSAVGSTLYLNRPTGRISFSVQ